MQLAKVLEKLDNWSVGIGALTFATMLVVDLMRPNANPAWIIFDVAMLAFCLGHMITWLPIVDEVQGIAIKSITGELVGAALMGAFFCAVVNADNGAEFALALVVTLGGAWLLCSSTARMRDLYHAIEKVRGDRR